MSEAVLQAGRGPLARIKLVGGRDARAPKNFMPLLLAGPLIAFMLVFGVGYLRLQGSSYHLPRWMTSPIGRRFGLAIGRRDRSAG